MKRCASCGKTKPLTEFHKHTHNSNGYRPRCKVCRAIEQKALSREYHAARYAKDREKRLAHHREYRKTHAKELAEKGKIWREANRDILRSKVLMRNYGITLEQWHEMFEKQGKACLICRSTTPNNKRGWHTDHGVTVRGILCHHCNTGIGMFNHDIGRLKAAIRYLSR